MAGVQHESVGDSLVADADLSEIEENVTHAEDFERRLDTADDDIAFASFTTTLGEIMINEIGDEFGKKESALMTVQKKRSDMRREMYLIAQLKATAEGQLLEAVKADLARAKASFVEEESVLALERCDTLAVAGAVETTNETTADNIGSSMVVSLLQDLEDTVASTDLHTYEMHYALPMHCLLTYECGMCRSRLKGKLALVSKRCLQAEHVNQRLRRERERLLKALQIATAEQKSSSEQQGTSRVSGKESLATRPIHEPGDISTDLLATKLQKMYRDVRNAKQQQQPGRRGSSSSSDFKPCNEMSGRRTKSGDAQRRTGRFAGSVRDSNSVASLDVSDTSDAPTRSESSHRSSATGTLRVQGSHTGTPSLSTWDTLSTSTGDVSTRHGPTGLAPPASRSTGTTSEPTRPKGARLVWGADGDWRWEEVEPHWRREEGVRPDESSSDSDSDATAASHRKALDGAHHLHREALDVHSRSVGGNDANRSSSISVASWVRGAQGGPDPTPRHPGSSSSVASSVRAGGSASSVSTLSRSQAFLQAMSRRRAKRCGEEREDTR